MIAEGGYLRTGDLGRLDADGYLWITGRAKDLIIRGGHNIDPGMIEEALMAHPAVAFVGAIGQPDAHSGELPAAYVELCAGAAAERRGADRLRPDPHRRAGGGAQASRDRAGAAEDRRGQGLQARPAPAGDHPRLRRGAGRRRLGDRVAAVVEDRRLGLVAELAAGPDGRDEAAVAEVLGRFVVPWRWQAA